MRKLRLFIALGAILALSVPAYAQDDDDFGDSGMGGDTGMGDSSGGSSSSGGDTGGDTGSSGGSATVGGDFGQTDGAWGFQVTNNNTIVAGILTGVALPAVGVRKWTGDSGIEGGLTLAIVHDGGGSTTDIIAGANAGMMKAFAVYDHMAVFWEPEAQFFVLVPDGGDTAWNVNLLGNVGAEVRLGMVGLPRIGLTAKIGAGVYLGDPGDGFDFALVVGNSQQASVRGLLEGTVGFVFYK